MGLINEISAQPDWASLILRVQQRAMALPETSLNTLMDLTVIDSRASDMAALVASAAEPGLKQRILDYRQQLQAARNK